MIKKIILSKLVKNCFNSALVIRKLGNTLLWLRKHKFLESLK